MRLVRIAVALAALIASTAVAFAGEDRGTITKIEWGLGTISLDNGKIYIVPPSLQDEVVLHVGDKVKVTFEGKTASAITKTA